MSIAFPAPLNGGKTMTGGQEPREDGDAKQAADQTKKKDAPPAPATGGQEPREDGGA